MFSVAYLAIKEHVQEGDWFADVDMTSGRNRKNRVESLHGFWPGMESTIGMSESSTQLLNSLYAMWTDLGFLPEEIDQLQWLSGKDVVANAFYPLRPELIESTYHHYRTTGDRSWLNAGVLFLESLESMTKTDCGYAAIENILTKKLSDVMPSFFLSETCKYLYLLFDEHNFMHDRGYIFSTEAHPFSPLQLPSIHRRHGRNDTDSDTTSVQEEVASSEEVKKDRSESPDDHLRDSSSLTTNLLIQSSVAAGISPSIMDSFQGKRCRKRLWWDRSVGFDAEYLSPVSKSSKRFIGGAKRRENIELNEFRSNAMGVAAHSINKIAAIVREIDKSNGNSFLLAAELYRDELVGAYTSEIDKRKSVCLPQDESASSSQHAGGTQQVVEVSSMVIASNDNELQQIYLYLFYTDYTDCVCLSAVLLLCYCAVLILCCCGAVGLWSR